MANILRLQAPRLKTDAPQMQLGQFLMNNAQQGFEFNEKKRQNKVNNAYRDKFLSQNKLNSDRDYALKLAEIKSNNEERTAKLQANTEVIKAIRPDVYSKIGLEFGSIPSIENAKKMDAVTGNIDVNDIKPKASNYSFKIAEDGSIIALNHNNPTLAPINTGVKAQKSKGTKINVNSKYSKFGPVPKGYMLVNVNGTPQMKPVIGSPAYTKAKELEEKEISANELLKRAGSVVFDDIGRLKEIIKNQGTTSPVTGTVTGLLPDALAQNRVDAESLKKTIVANIGFDRLQQMRDASPTGGALGGVSDREIATLQAVLGNLDLKQSQSQLITNINRLQEIYGEILKKANAYPNAKKFGFGGQNKQNNLTKQNEIITPDKAKNLGITFQ